MCAHAHEYGQDWIVAEGRLCLCQACTASHGSGSRTLRDVRAVAQRTLQRVARHMKRSAAPPGSFSELLQAVLDPVTGKPLTKRLVPEIGAMFTAGTDTTAHTLSYAL